MIWWTIILICLRVTEDKLQQAVLLFRHGARSQLPSSNEDSGFEGLDGELTPVGQRQLEILGQILRQQYIEEKKFLSRSFNQREVEIFSSFFNRTQQSAESLAYGLYPPPTGPKVKASTFELPPYNIQTNTQTKNYVLPTGHQPVPIHPVINAQILCPPYYDLLEQVVKRHRWEVLKMEAHYRPLLDKMGRIFNISGVKINDTHYIFDYLEVGEYLGKQPPSNITSSDLDNLRYLLGWYFSIRYGDEITKLQNNAKIQLILSHFDSRILLGDEHKTRFTFLSRHDSEMIPMLLILNLTSPTCIEEKWIKGKDFAGICVDFPSFASSILFQLHLQEQEYFVMIKYNGKYVNLCEREQKKCSYEEWKARMKANWLQNFQQVCGNQKQAEFQEQFPKATTKSRHRINL